MKCLRRLAKNNQEQHFLTAGLFFLQDYTHEGISVVLHFFYYQENDVVITAQGSCAVVLQVIGTAFAGKPPRLTH